MSWVNDQSSILMVLSAAVLPASLSTAACTENESVPEHVSSNMLQLIPGDDLRQQHNVRNATLKYDGACVCVATFTMSLSARLSDLMLIDGAICPCYFIESWPVHDLCNGIHYADDKAQKHQVLQLTHV